MPAPAIARVPPGHEIDEPGMREIRFGAYLREVTVQQRRIPYREVVLAGSRDDARRLRLTAREVYRIAEPYLGSRIADQARAVLPLAIYLVAFQVLILRQSVADSWLIAVGLLAVIVGLMMFMEGLRLGMMPFGETIGSRLPIHSPLPFVLLVTFALGIGVTFAEPAIGALEAAGAIVTAERAPYLAALLRMHAGALVLIVGVGVGLAAVTGTLRFLYGWSLKPLVYACLIPALGLTAWMGTRPDLREVIGLAWDCGAVTTGPVTVPLVLSLGIGIAASAGKRGTTTSGFGIVTLASLFPVIGVLGLAAFVAHGADPSALVQALQEARPAAEPAWFERTPGAEIVAGVRAIVPLVAFLLVILLGVLRERLRHPGVIAYGVALAVAGMCVFNIGLSYGLAELGGQSGSLVPAAFTSIDVVRESPIYGFGVGLAIAVVFAWVLGFGATLAEPALNALGLTVENLTNGAFRKRVLLYAVSVGVGFGIAAGVVKILFDLPLAWILVPGYAFASVLTAFSSEEFVNVAWDSAGVTTGPVTVPLVLALGLGFGNAVGAAEGFGILALASLGPIVSVLSTGLWIRWQVRRRHHSEERIIGIAGTGST